MPEFIPGLELARLYYAEAVRPILEAEFPHLAHSAGLIGPGSEVLGFDTEMSADHSWGPQVVVFLSERDHGRYAEQVHETLGYKLPYTFRGYPTHFEELTGEPGTLMPRVAGIRPINHRVQVTTLHGFVQRHSGIDLDQGPDVHDWLVVPEQKLRTLVAGAVYHDGLHVLAPMRRMLAHYPHDLWLYLLSAQWRRIGQEEPFVGRAGVVGDDVGSAVIAARLVRDVMRLCLLMERQYAPYPKWFGSAFAQLDCAPGLTPLLEGALRARDWQERERFLSPAYEIVAAKHNDLGITAPVPARVSRFHDRPFFIIQGEAIAKAIWDVIEDEEVRSLPFGVGKVDQWVDSTDILSSAPRWRMLKVLYTEQP
jgi:hypothetical protein